MQDAMEPNERPNPDELMRRVQMEQARSKRGKLKVFLGFAPGVGKTYRMLQVTRDLVSDQQLDVVVGIVEAHGRRETASMVLGLELLPRRKVEYRGRVLEEFDLDVALARKPKLILVDELAHTNPAGSRHPKRWQDVEELLDAGIDVFTTINVQHLESLNDVIAQITRVQVRETVPDAVLDRADAVELVDIAPEELLQRLRDGKVYLPGEANRAAEHFFRAGNLLALREIALRRTAQHVDEDVREYREEHGVVATWPAGERILVCVGPAPSSGRLVRATARMAAGLRCPWVAAYVDRTSVGLLSDQDRERLEGHLRLAESLGGVVTRLTGSSIASALLAYARKHNVTRIILGKPTHSRLRDRLRGSLLDAVVRASGDIDVHVITGDSSTDASPRTAPTEMHHASAVHYVSAVLSVAATLGLALLLRRTMGLPDVEMLFLLVVMITAVWLGRGPSTLVAGLSVACYDFFFVPPLHTLLVVDRRYVLTFAMMFGVGFVMSELTARLRYQEREALSREESTATLYELTKDLASTDQPTQIAEIAARHTSSLFGAGAVVLGASGDSELRLLGASPPETALDQKDLGVATWAYEHDEWAGLGTDTLPGARTLCAPLRAGNTRLGVLALVPSKGGVFRTEQRAFLDVFCRQITAAFERARLSDVAKASALRAKTEEMRASLLSTVSHDLRTPLASITGAATEIRDDPNLRADTRKELIDSIVAEAERLERLVANLLDMTRLESGLALNREWVPLEEVIGSALTRLESRLHARQVTIEIAPDVPWVLADPVLFEQVFVNLFENADKYTPSHTAIEIRARYEEPSVVIEVSDHGPGLPPGTERSVFEKFFRAHAGASGAGLGLAICRGIVEAHGGNISAHNGPDGGASFHITIPSAGTPPLASKGPMLERGESA